MNTIFEFSVLFLHKSESTVMKMAMQFFQNNVFLRPLKSAKINFIHVFSSMLFKRSKDSKYSKNWGIIINTNKNEPFEVVVLLFPVSSLLSPYLAEQRCHDPQVLWTGFYTSPRRPCCCCWSCRFCSLQHFVSSSSFFYGLILLRDENYIALYRYFHRKKLSRMPLAKIIFHRI